MNADRSGRARHVDRGTLAAMIVLLALVAFCGVVVWRLDLFGANANKSNGQVIAAALALIGVLVTAALTFVGVLLKNSIDARTLQQGEETEGRLRLETSIRAVELLTEDGKPATQTRQAGALFVLVNLNQLDFAFALLGQMWPKGDISPGAAVWVVNRILLNGDPRLRNEVAGLLKGNAASLATADGNYELPDCINLVWDLELPSNARENLVSMVPLILLARPYDEWLDGALNALTLQLDVIRRKDGLGYIRDGAALCLSALLETRDLDEGTVLFAPEGPLDVSALRTELTAAIPTISTSGLVSEHLELASRLRVWRQPQTGEPPLASDPT